MALKDWKKIRKINRWESKDDQIGFGRIKDKYRVYSIYGKFKDKYFKTKTHALKYAKAYMRKN